ncbi:MAG TPA: hypothetical protein VMW50_09060 [Dehalococcoidia bacterium]|nr:hypothetical protein [Dehalococcoidia bacterium]
MKTIACYNMIRIGATGDYCDGCEHDIDEVNCPLFLERKDGADGRCKSCLFAERLVEIIIAERVSCAKPYMPDEL